MLSLDELKSIAKTLRKHSFDPSEYQGDNMEYLRELKNKRILLLKVEKLSQAKETLFN
jgi:hypothetical protein